MKRDLAGRRVCGNADCPDPYCVSSCEECGGLLRHAEGCPLSWKERNR